MFAVALQAASRTGNNAYYSEPLRLKKKTFKTKKLQKKMVLEWLKSLNILHHFS